MSVTAYLADSATSSTPQASTSLAIPTSTVAFRPGTTRAVNAIVRPTSDGDSGYQVQNDSNGPVPVVIAVNGYFN